MEGSFADINEGTNVYYAVVQKSRYSLIILNYRIDTNLTFEIIV